MGTAAATPTVAAAWLGWRQNSRTMADAVLNASAHPDICLTADSSTLHGFTQAVAAATRYGDADGSILLFRLPSLWHCVRSESVRGTPLSALQTGVAGHRTMVKCQRGVALDRLCGAIDRYTASRWESRSATAMQFGRWIEGL